MKRTLILHLLFIFSANIWAQATFKAGWSTYQTGTIVHEYTYNITDKDSVRLYIEDSTITWASQDSTMVMSLKYQPKLVSKKLEYLNTHKLVTKSEEYLNDALQVVNEYKYDEKNRVTYHYEDNKAAGKTYKKLYEYSTDKKKGELEVTESSYLDGRIEFYTKTYYNKQNVKYKEMRLNDNNRDVVHIENFTYGENGRLKERSIYFPEWKVTKTFPEIQGSLPVKCFNTFPIGPAEVVNLNNRIFFMKKLMAKNSALLHDNDCTEFQYKFTNKTNCEIELVPTKVNHGRHIIFRFRQKVV